MQKFDPYIDHNVRVQIVGTTPHLNEYANVYVYKAERTTPYGIYPFSNRLHIVSRIADYPITYMAVNDDSKVHYFIHTLKNIENLIKSLYLSLNILVGKVDRTSDSMKQAISSAKQGSPHQSFSLGLNVKPDMSKFVEKYDDLNYLLEIKKFLDAWGDDTVLDDLMNEGYESAEKFGRKRKIQDD